MFQSIALRNYRSYEEKSFTFSPEVTIIAGPNASGKTNLLEALLVLARGSSYRAKDQDLIYFDKPWARLDTKLDDNTRTLKIVRQPRPIKTYEIDGKPYQRLSLQHTIPTVLFEPNHLSLLAGSPEQRRLYLDDLLEQTVPHYATTLRHYRRVLLQRNKLLKRLNKPTNEELFPWNLRLSELGAVIARQRSTISQDIDRVISNHYTQLSRSKTQVRFTYHPKLPLESYESSVLQKLETDLPLDLARGFTAAGPHREDFVVTFDSHPAEEVASRGETRTAVLALKIIELETIAGARDTAPVILLDDVFSELDTVRRQALTEHLSPYQTFITTTDADIVGKTAGISQLIRLT